MLGITHGLDDQRQIHLGALAAQLEGVSQLLILEQNKLMLADFPLP